MTDRRSTVDTTTDQFPTDPSGLPEARGPEVIELSDGDELDLRIAPVAKKLGDATVRMLAYNGSIPGPILKLPQERGGGHPCGEPRRPGGNRALAWTPPAKPL
jgi:hypothetical protein